ncbi:hypothetical protein GCM10007973_28700 [Polymorphobacter multimanifer]|uniref:Adenine/guanine phosphoribosyltransferase-like PRPP-binding protein n=1 Tax=Polymorphobacter multimanifer TaxID=1070431 RepID=A0A841LBK4_9SPHN|nr:DUF3572 family protein [Polymorphobacter multimanifer]MBB6226532.1 adenine/guanine phosphoribosyltransferase-like PRPP-binding protein [Polymorphobacter multimanifer]GGI90624.1 hypothetical protein GCM10007973_28700 [Polymorphobacter multimanifer]
MLKMPPQAVPPADVLGLQALAHVIADADMGPRFLALTGLDPAALRTRAGEPALLAEVIGFLAARESDLVAAAEALGVPAAALAAAGERLQR